LEKALGIFASVAPMTVTPALAECQVILDYVAVGLARFYEICYNNITRQQASLSVHDEMYFSQRDTAQAIIDYGREAQILLASLGQEVSLKPLAQVTATQLKPLQQLLMRQFPHIPAWKEETLGGYFLAAAREHRKASLAGGQAEVKSELHFLYGMTAINNYERAMKVLTVSLAYVSNSVCADSFKICLVHEGHASAFRLEKRVVVQALEFLEDLALEASHCATFLNQLLKEGKLTLAPPGHLQDEQQALVFERLTFVTKVLHWRLQWLRLLVR
jgi:hypothetical protein